MSQSPLRPLRFPPGSGALRTALGAVTLACLGWSQDPQHFGLPQGAYTGAEHPTALTYGPQGFLWIADLDTRRVLGVDPEGELQIAFQWPKQSRVGGITHDEDGLLWVTDQWNHRLFHVDRRGRIQFASDQETLLHPEGLVRRGEELWVADTGHGRLAIFDLEGRFLREVGAQHLQRPRALCSLGEDRVAVVDSARAQVLVLDSEGNLVSEVGGWGWFPGQFSEPSDIAWHAGRLYVADRENQRLQVLSEQGEALYRIGTHAIVPREGDGKLHYPTHLALDAEGQRLAVAEPMDGRVQFFGLAPGAKPAPNPRRPESVQPSPHYGPRWALAGQYLAIPEPESHRVRLFDLRLVPQEEPVEITQIGGFGASLGLFRNPGAVWLRRDPLTLWVADRGNQRLVEVALDLDPSEPLAQNLRAARFVRSLDWAAWNAGLPEAQRLPETPRVEDLVRLEDGRMLVLCWNNRQVLVLDDQARLVRKLPGPKPMSLFAPRAIAWHPASQQMALVDEGSAAAWLVDLKGENPRPFGVAELRRPTGIGFRANGNVLVIDRALNEWLEYSPQGELIQRRFGRGLGREELWGPTDFALDEQDRLFVLDHGNHRGMVFGPKGEWLAAFGSRLYTRPARLPHAPMPTAAGDGDGNGDEASNGEEE